MATKAFVCHTFQQGLRGAPGRMELLHRNIAFPTFAVFDLPFLVPFSMQAS